MLMPIGESTCGTNNSHSFTHRSHFALLYSNNVGFTRYRTLAFDPKGKGLAWDGQIAKGGTYVQFTPYGMVMDRGLGRPRWGIYADCYGNGVCRGLKGNFVCECNPGYYGDCQAAECPKGKPWFSGTNFTLNWQ